MHAALFLSHTARARALSLSARALSFSLTHNHRARFLTRTAAARNRPQVERLHASAAVEARDASEDRFRAARLAEELSQKLQAPRFVSKVPWSNRGVWMDVERAEGAPALSL
eukprot:6183851-Pleurochrysis_carterae.AAC.4